MTRLEDRQILLHDIAQARVQGARLAPACALAGIDVRTLQRWQAMTAYRAVIAGRMLAARSRRTH